MKVAPDLSLTGFVLADSEAFGSIYLNRQKDDFSVEKSFDLGNSMSQGGKAVPDLIQRDVCIFSIRRLKTIIEHLCILNYKIIKQKLIITGTFLRSSQGL